MWKSHISESKHARHFKLTSCCTVVRFWICSPDYSLNCAPVCPVTTTNIKMITNTQCAHFFYLCPPLGFTTKLNLMYHNRPMEQWDAWMGSSTRASQIFNRLLYTILWHQILSDRSHRQIKQPWSTNQTSIEGKNKPNTHQLYYSANLKNQKKTKVIAWLLLTLTARRTINHIDYNVFLFVLCSQHSPLFVHFT